MLDAHRLSPTVRSVHMDALDAASASRSDVLLRASTQLEPGPCGARLEQVDLDGLTLTASTDAVARSDHFAVAPGRTLVALVTRRSGSVRWRGVDLTPGDLVVCRAGVEHFVATGPGFDSLQVTIDDAVAIESGVLPDDDLGDAGEPERGLLRIGHRHASRLERLLAFPFTSRDRGRLASMQSSDVAPLRDELLHRLGDAIDECRRAPTATTRAESARVRSRLAHRALALIDERPRHPRSTAELASALGVGVRSLQYAFADVVGTSPHRYLLARRLHAARRMLLDESTPERPVTHAALHHGFTDLGRFSSRYRALFGESPSATVARRRRT